LEDVVKLKPTEVLTTETCGGETCTAMSAIIYAKGTLHPDVSVGLCESCNLKYTTEGVTTIPKYDASNPAGETTAAPAAETKKKRGRPKKAAAEPALPLAAVTPAAPVTVPVSAPPAAPYVPGTVATPQQVQAGVDVIRAQVSEELEIPKMGMVLAFTTEAKTEAANTLTMLREVKLVTPEQEQWAMNAANLLAKRHDELEKKRKSWTAPLKKVTGDIEAEFRPVLQLLDEGVAILKSKVGEYRYALEQEKQKALAAMSAAVSTGNTQQAQALATQIETLAPPPPEKGTVTMVWTGQVTNAMEIPRQYLVPDVNALLAITASLKRDPGIPGWKAWEVPDVRISRR
jgi:hypothetical protein